MVDAFPLQWPSGWSRTVNRSRSNFKCSFAQSRDETIRQLRLMNASQIVISSNVPLRRDGLPYAVSRDPDDTGVAVYFVRKGKNQCIPCDKWSRVADNLHAIELTIDALRGLDRWGAKETVDAAFTGFQALPDYSQGTDYFAGCDTSAKIEERYIKLAKENHPDLGGDTQVMAVINEQYSKKKGAR